MFLLPLLAASAGEMNSTILVGSSRLDIAVENGQFDVTKDGLLDWVRSAAEAVANYYGHFPVAHVLIRITPREGKGIGRGMTFGKGGGLITIQVGAETTSADFRADWMLTHEMTHLAFPSVRDNHHWLEEGIATYVEPIARVRAKQLDVSEMWYEVVRDLPQGLPEPGDKGLDHTHTWGRTYWGGALFCLLADVEIHRQTGNKKGLDDALRGILEAGGNIAQDWELQKALSAGDHATGVNVLISLYDKMKDQPSSVDLDALWKELGIERDGKSVHFVESAPLASTRQAITFGGLRVPSKSAATFESTTVFAGRSAGSSPFFADSTSMDAENDAAHPGRRSPRN
jgi:predicted metalloprotease with PDZ domain